MNRIGREALDDLEEAIWRVEGFKTKLEFRRTPNNCFSDLTTDTLKRETQKFLYFGKLRIEILLDCNSSTSYVNKTLIRETPPGNYERFCLKTNVFLSYSQTISSTEHYGNVSVLTI